MGTPTPEDDRLADLAQVLAHRIRGLVTGIEGFTDLLMETLTTREQRELGMRIHESAVRIERVLADLQRFGQPVEPFFRQVTVRSLVDEMLMALHDAELERVRFDIQVPPEQALHADPMLVRQALLVLVQNALDATKSEGGVVFHARLLPAAGAVRFDVINDGVIALAEADEQVFKPFFTTKAHNLGVGLTLARRIVRAHRGSLRLMANDAEQGTCFSLTLPIGGDEG